MSTIAERPSTNASGPVTAVQIPLTEAQREIWFAAQISEGASLAYNESTTLRLEGTLNSGALRRALRALVSRHDLLRARISEDGQSQRISPAGDLTFQSEELPAGLSPAEQAQQASAWLDAQVARQFELAGGALFRAALLRIDAQTHYLTLVAHHVICDGWSLGVLTRELTALYEAEQTGRAARLSPTLPVAAFAEAQQRPASITATEAARSYWATEFNSAPPALELPADRPRPPQRSYRGETITRTLPPELSRDLLRLAAQHDCTPFTILFAGFGLMVHRLNGLDELVIGVPSATQVMAGMESLVGQFANLLAIRSEVRGNPSFTAYLARTREKIGAAMEHWRMPFGALLQQLNLPRDAGRVPLAPVIFNMTGRHQPIAFGGLTATVVTAPKPFVTFDLNVSFGLHGDAFVLGGYYSAELFKRETVARWFTHLETLFRAIVQQPDRPVHELPLLSESERQVIVHAWNETALPYRRDVTVAQLFEEQAARGPDAIALVDGAERISYAELNRRAEAVARRLRGCGVRPDTVVGVLLERSAPLLAAILGVLKAGGAYLPLDPSHPNARLEWVLADAGATVVLTQQRFADLVAADTVEAIFVDSPTFAGSSDAAEASGGRANPSHLAYVIYTSGSTGQPKGVCVEHRNVAALVAWAAKEYSAEELDGVLYATAQTFDVSVFESLVPLCLGGKIILAENILAANRLPASGEVRLLSGVPSAVAELLRAAEIPASVRTINVAGEPCPQSLVDALYEQTPVKRVIDVYGPTETTVYSTGSVRQAGGRATIGRPLPNERAYILDPRMQPVPIGVRGELFLGGDKLARGYLHRPELTSERFLSSPFVTGERIYRTGDFARFLPDGRIEYLGRIDHQVKIRGYRIELGEIEAALGVQPGVTDAAVIAFQDHSGGQQLAAYVAGPVDAPETVARLREALRERLPEYMVPAHLLVLPKLPRTSSGKIDRRALPEVQAVAGGAEQAPPQTATEELLAQIWSDVLNARAIGIHDNFFVLGGHSLLAAQVLARVREAFEVDVSLRDFFAAPTIAAFAASLERALIADIAATNPQADTDRRDPDCLVKEHS